MSDFFEIFTLITGIIYIVLEIRQKNFMWVVGILTSAAAMWVFFRQGLYASFGLNTYYLITSFVGLWQWRRYKGRLADKTSGSCDGETGAEKGDGEEAGVIHLNRLRPLTIGILAFILPVGTYLLGALMEYMGNPMSYLDSLVTVLSAVATWWLVKSYPQQWLLWIVADGLSMGLCASQGLWWMTALYGAYALSAVYGYWHWTRKGTYIV